MKFTHDQLDPISLQLKQVLDSIDYLRQELHPYYPDNSDEPRSTPDELFEISASLLHEQRELHELIGDIFIADEPDLPRPEIYDTTTEMHDDLGTFDRSPRD